jgi:anti-sigma regulatory factor (Ser/Thr protein kinase)
VVAWSTDEARERAAPDILVAALGSRCEELAGLMRGWRAQGRSPLPLWLADSPGPAAWRLLAAFGGELLLKPLRLADFLQAVETHQDDGRMKASWRLAAAPEAVERGARELLSLAAALGLRPTLRARLLGAACELIENAVRHAGASRGEELLLSLERGAGEVWLRVRDQGAGFEPPASLPGTGGLARAARLCEAMRIESELGRGTSVELRFDAPGPEPALGPAPDWSDHDYLAPAEVRWLLCELRRGRPGMASGLSPALAVVVGRLLGAAPAELVVARPKLEPEGPRGPERALGEAAG